jgi:hypothetical protein
MGDGIQNTVMHAFFLPEHILIFISKEIWLSLFERAPGN